MMRGRIRKDWSTILSEKLSTEKDSMIGIWHHRGPWGFDKRSFIRSDVNGSPSTAH